MVASNESNRSPATATATAPISTGNSEHGIGNGNGPHAQVPLKLNAFESFIAGGVAGACAKTVIAPGDRVKIMYQVDKTKIFTVQNAWNTARGIVRQDGLLALWRGNMATLMRVIPYAATTYVCYPRYEAGLRQVLSVGHAHHNRKEDVVVRFCAGAASGATAVTLTYPLDLLRARMAVQQSSGGTTTKYWSTFRELQQKSGFCAIYSGLRPTLLGIVPYAGTSFATYETLKVYIRRITHCGSDADISTHWRLAAGGLSGLVAQSFSYPLDILRRRMQVGDKLITSMSTWRALVHIAQSEGLRGGLYKGLSMNWVKGPVAVAVSFTVNDEMKAWLYSRHQKEAD